MKKMQSIHVWKDLFLAIITVDFPKNRARTRKLQSHLKRNGLCEGLLFYGEKTKKGSDMKERNNLVFKGHYDVCQWFATNRPSKYLFILEDDAYICQKNIGEKIKRHIRFLNKNSPEWFVLSLGCISSKMMQHVNNDLYKGAGYAAHSYILNGETLGSYLKDIPLEKWQTPHCVEHWGAIPLDCTYMVHPMMLTQDVHFTNFIYMLLPGINNSHILLHYINTVNTLNIHRWKILILIIIVFAYIVVKPRLNFSRLNIS